MGKFIKLYNKKITEEIEDSRAKERVGDKDVWYKQKEIKKRGERKGEIELSDIISTVSGPKARKINKVVYNLNRISNEINNLKKQYAENVGLSKELDEQYFTTEDVIQSRVLRTKKVAMKFNKLIDSPAFKKKVVDRKVNVEKQLDRILGLILEAAPELYNKIKEIKDETIIEIEVPEEKAIWKKPLKPRIFDPEDYEAKQEEAEKELYQKLKAKYGDLNEAFDIESLKAKGKAFVNKLISAVGKAKDKLMSWLPSYDKKMNRIEREVDRLEAMLSS